MHIHTITNLFAGRASNASGREKRQRVLIMGPRGGSTLLWSILTPTVLRAAGEGVMPWVLAAATQLPATQSRNSRFCAQIVITNKSRDIYSKVKTTYSQQFFWVTAGLPENSRAGTPQITALVLVVMRNVCRSFVATTPVFLRQISILLNTNLKPLLEQLACTEHAMHKQNRTDLFLHIISEYFYH